MLDLATGAVSTWPFLWRLLGGRGAGLLGYAPSLNTCALLACRLLLIACWLASLLASPVPGTKSYILLTEISSGFVICSVCSNLESPSFAVGHLSSSSISRFWEMGGQVKCNCPFSPIHLAAFRLRLQRTRLDKQRGSLGFFYKAHV